MGNLCGIDLWLAATMEGFDSPILHKSKRNKMENINIKDLIKDNTVEMDRYRAQHIYYTIAHKRKVYSFPVPLEDVQDATLNHSEKAITMMRYIRMAINNGTFVEA